MSIQAIRGPGFACFAVVALAWLAGAGAASAQTTFRIEQIYSNLDGSAQYIQLRESAGRDGQQAIKGLTITSTSAGISTSVTIPHDLLWPATAGQPVLISTSRTPSACCDVGREETDAEGNIVRYGPVLSAATDFPILPDRFLAIGGGTISFAGVDTVSYPALPLTGQLALDRTGNTVAAKAYAFQRSVNPLGVIFEPPTLTTVVPDWVRVREYYHVEFDRYFITANAAEIAALEAGALAGWTPSDEGFLAGTFAGEVPVGPPNPRTLDYKQVPVCRHYLPPPLGGSHFYSASAEECTAVAANLPGAVLESSAAFYVNPADRTTGNCTMGVPVYRLWNARTDTNHRYTTSTDIRAAMIAKGWVPEGYGALGVAFCA